MRKNWLLLVISALLAVLLTEGIIRILEFGRPNLNVSNPGIKWVIPQEQVWTDPHPILGWYNQKGKAAILKNTDVYVQVNTNSHGFRGRREYQTQKPISKIRILCLGDSYVFGWGVRDEETFCAQLESGVKNLEAINLAAAGYGVDQFFLSYRVIGKNFHPDFVLIGLYPEDFWRASRSYTDTGYGKPYFTLTMEGHLVLHNVPVKGPAELEYRQFPDLIEHEWWESMLLHSSIYRYLKHKTLRLARDLGWVDPDLTEEWLLGRIILKELIREARQNGSRPVILLIPPVSWMTNAKLTSPQKSIRRFANRENVPLVDLTPYLIEAATKSSITDFYYKDDKHWTAQAHKLAADVLIAQLDFN